MQITCWGVRGSIPAPDPDNQRHGGNTSCVSVELADRILVLDAGTGIRPLGQELLGGEKPIYVALTHVHSDHIEGFPFFKPLYEESRPIYLLDHVYDVQGKLVRTLVDGHQGAGVHEVTWRGRDDRGGEVASGLYFYRLRSDGGDHVRKMTLLK